MICSVILVRLLGEDSQLGRLVHWIRDDELSAIAFGLPVDRLQIVLFVFLALFSGLAGVGIVASQGYVSPRSFDLWLSLTVLTVVYLSGTGGNPLAMFAGAMTVVVLNELMRSFGSMPELVGPIQQIALNVILIAVLLVRRRGIAGPVIEFGPSANRLE
jgi:branched-chain amino acid transport system permease protein